MVNRGQARAGSIHFALGCSVQWVQAGLRLNASGGQCCPPRSSRPCSGLPDQQNRKWEAKLLQLRGAEGWPCRVQHAGSTWTPWPS